MQQDIRFQNPGQHLTQEQLVDAIREWNEITSRMQSEIQEFYRLETNFLNNLPRELINAILEHQNQNARWVLVYLSALVNLSNEYDWTI